MFIKEYEDVQLIHEAHKTIHLSIGKRITPPIHPSQTYTNPNNEKNFEIKN